MPRFSSRYTTVRFEDAVAAGMTIGPGPGDFSFGMTNAENTEKVRVLDRGTYDGHVEGDDLEQEFSITVGLKNESLTHATVNRVLDFVQKTGNFAAAQSVNPNTDVWSFKGIVTMVLGGVTATFTLPVCTGGYAYAEAKEGSAVTVSGSNNGPIVRT